MYKNPVWLAFLALVLLAVLWFCAKAGYGVYEYWSLSKHTPVQTVTFEAQENDGEFGVVAKYTFEYKGAVVERTEALKGRVYPNSWVAKDTAAAMQKQSWNVWFNPSNVQHSSLIKEFPTKVFISALVLVGLMVYFLVLGLYVKWMQTNKEL